MQAGAARMSTYSYILTQSAKLNHAIDEKEFQSPVVTVTPDISSIIAKPETRLVTPEELNSQQIKTMDPVEPSTAELPHASMFNSKDQLYIEK